MKTSHPISKLFLLIMLLLAGRSALAQDAKPSNSSPGGARAASTQQISTAAAAVFRTSPFDPPDASDISFFTDVAPRLDTGCTFRSGGPLVYQIEIKRFLGELNPDGTLKDARALVAAGLLSPTVKLIMPGFDIDSGPPPPDVAPEIDRVSFNGQPIGVLSGQNNQWVLNSFEIPVEKVKFAERGADGGEPTGGVNEIRIDIDTANLDEVWCTSIDWGSASFKAASPIILIHGNNSSSWFFLRQGFTFALRKEGFVVDDSINMETKSRSDNAEDLNEHIPDIARELGARNVHLVTHSKGGLDTREYLARFQRQHQRCFKVLTLTTLSGPHDGSIGADLRIERAIAAKNVGLLGKIEYVGFPAWTRGVAWYMSPDEATPDLTTGAAARFNPRNVPRLRGLGVTYNTVGADADRNGNQHIDRRYPDDEYFWLRIEDPKFFLFDLKFPDQSREIVDAMYQIVRNTPGLSVTYRRNLVGRKIATISNVMTVPPVGPKQNDIMVSTDSARGLGGFHKLVTNFATFTGSEARNHSSVADDEVARTVIPWIRAAEHSKGGLR
jgi:triacylglycerol lipase